MKFREDSLVEEEDGENHTTYLQILSNSIQIKRLTDSTVCHYIDTPLKNIRDMRG